MGGGGPGGVAITSGTAFVCGYQKDLIVTVLYLCNGNEKWL